MNRRIFLTVVLTCIVVLSCDRPSSDNKFGPYSETVQNDLPSMRVRLLDGTEKEVKQLEGKVVLIFFQPDCDHCQREASEIAQNINAFKDVRLYFITSDNAGRMEKFAQDYKLDQFTNVFFAQASTESVLKNFGPIQTPSMYIYSDEKRLVKAFNGEAPISTILKFI